MTWKVAFINAITPVYKIIGFSCTEIYYLGFYLSHDQYYIRCVKD